MSTVELTPTSYVVLGLLALRGPATSYDLKQAVSTSIGHFWSFPHTQLYTEPRRLADAGLVDEEQEEGGRRRRTYTLTPAGRDALHTWLGEPATGPLELRDVGLLQLFLSSGVDVAQVRRLAEAQLEMHRGTLATYERIDADAGAEGAATPQRAALRLGLAVERAYVAFWSDIASEPPTDVPPATPA